MRLRWRLALLIGILAIGIYATNASNLAVAKPAPSPSASPTNPPTPYMAPEQATNGTWDVILQAQGHDPSYSTMKLKDVGNTVSGVWIADKKTTYNLTGKRDGTHLTMDISLPSKPDAVIGKIDADIDGIADIVGLITINNVDTPFQAAQHSRVPPPVEASPGANPTPTPY
jgi:hypothetical protein